MVTHKELQRGTRVLGRFKNDLWFLGTVIKINDNNKIDVKFDDGDVCTDFKVNDLAIVNQNTPANDAQQAPPTRANVVPKIKKTKKKRKPQKQKSVDQNPVQKRPRVKQMARKAQLATKKKRSSRINNKAKTSSASSAQKNVNAVITRPCCSQPLPNWHLCKKYPKPVRLPSGKCNITYRYKSANDPFECPDCKRHNFSMGNFPSELLADVTSGEANVFRKYIHRRFEDAAKKSCIAVRELLNEFKKYSNAKTFDEKKIKQVCPHCHGTGFVQ